MPKWLVYGEEPYLIDKFRKKIIDEVETPEFNLMETSEFTEAEQNFLCQHALFGDKKVLIYRANSLKESGEFVKYVSEKGKTTDTYIFVQEVDRRSKVYKMFKKEEVQVFKKLSRDVLEMAEQLAAQIHSRVFDTKIRSGVAIAEAPAHGESIFSYNPRSAAVKDYLLFLNEIAPAIHLKEVSHNG